MSKIVIPGQACPSNLHLRDNVKIVMVESDVYDICNRLAEISPSLFIVQAEDENNCEYIIMEHCVDGTDRLVYKTNELDQRVLEKCAFMQKVPFEQRAELAIKEAEAAERAQKETESEELFENLGRPMWSQLEHDGFIDGRGVSYAKGGMYSKRR